MKNDPEPDAVLNVKRMPIFPILLVVPVLLLLFSLAALHAYSKAKGSFPPFRVKAAYVGTWSAPQSEVTVRTEPKKWHFEFTKGRADFSMTINADKTVSGHIGQARFEHARLEKNWGLPPSWTGIIYVVRCGPIGKIFDTDPLASKEVEIWICPVKADGTMEVELRFGNFPMAGFINRKTQ